jgi:hypothetical protein
MIEKCRPANRCNARLTSIQAGQKVCDKAVELLDERNVIDTSPPGRWLVQRQHKNVVERIDENRRSLNFGHHRFLSSSEAPPLITEALMLPLS